MTSGRLFRNSEICDRRFMSEIQNNIVAELNLTFGEFSGMGRIGTLFFQLGNKEKAKQIFEGLVEMDSENADAHSALGAAYLSLGNEEKAVSHLVKSLELNSEQIAPYVNLAQISIRRLKLLEAMNFLASAIVRDPHRTHPGANRARAMIYGVQKIISED